MLDIYASVTGTRYTGYLNSNQRRLKRHGNDLEKLVGKLQRYLAAEDTYGWLEIIDNTNNEIVRRWRKPSQLPA